MNSPLLEALTDIRQRLKKDEYKNEEHVRFSLVGRVLQLLGWDLWNPSEVNTEEQPHEENHTKVDISLRIWTPKPAAVYIECKRVKKLIPELEKVEKQMYGYSGKNAASLIILTDGQHWYLYWPFGQVSFHERLFATYDLATHDLQSMAADLTAVLGRTAVADGSARSVAENRWDARRMLQKMNDLLPEAKNNIVEHHNDRNLNQELVHLMHHSGFSDTTVDDVKQFLTGGISSKKSLPKLEKSFSVVKEEAQLATKKIIEVHLNDKLTQVSDTASQSSVESFKFKGRGGDATAWLLPDGRMQVLAGSKAAGTVTNAFAKQKLRDQLQTEGVLEAEDGNLVFTSDYVFKTPNAAADIVYGNPINALTAWRHVGTGATLKTLLAEKQMKA